MFAAWARASKAVYGSLGQHLSEKYPNGKSFCRKNIPEIYQACSLQILFVFWDCTSFPDQHAPVE